jgi:hypothetical protein
MPQVRLLAPWTNAKGEPQASGAVIDVSDDEARDLTARGHASLIEEEKKLEEQQAISAVYNDRLTRESAPAAAPAEETAPPPSA